MKAAVINLRKLNHYKRDGLVEVLCQSYGIDVPDSAEERQRLYENFANRQLLTEDQYGMQIANAMFGGGVDPGFGNLLKVVIGAGASTIPMITGGIKALAAGLVGSVFPIRKDFFDKLKNERNQTISKIKNAVGYTAAMDDVRKSLNNYGNDLVIGTLLFSPESFFAGKTAEALPDILKTTTEITKDNIEGLKNFVEGIFGAAVANKFKINAEAKAGKKIKPIEILNDMFENKDSELFKLINNLQKQFKENIEKNRGKATAIANQLKQKYDESLTKINNAEKLENLSDFIDINEIKRNKKYNELPEEEKQKKFIELKTKLTEDFNKLKSELDFELKKTENPPTTR